VEGPQSELNSYRGLHAARYDLIYADKPYRSEADFIADWVGRIRRGTGPGSLMDVACGTGRHALELAAMGWHVTGVDYNRELLERAREGASTRGLEVAFLEQDMRELDVDGRPFDVITCLFDSIGYGLKEEPIVEALRGMAKHLTPNGVLAVEFLHAAAVVQHYSPVKVRRFPTPAGGLILRISETELDRANQLIHVSYELIELKGDGAGYERATETQSNRFFSPEEMRAMMTRAGLDVHAIVPAYDDQVAISDETWHLIAFARPAEAPTP
jgi:ubiquinone/menaquinone biosynthesis C-methylase UbiE